MNQDISKDSVVRVRDILAQKGLTFEIKQFAQSTRTANEAASAIGCEVEQIMKSLLFRTVQTNQPVLILASGKNRVNEKAIEALMGETIVKADAEFTREITGFAIGGIPPLSNDKISAIFIDEDLLKYETLWAAAGTPYAVFSLSSLDISKITKGKVISIK